MSFQLSPTPVFKAFDNNGEPLFAGQLFTYAAGTTTPLATFTDSTGGTQNTNPIVLNPRGECNLWLTASVAYKLQLQDSFGNVIWTVDNVTANPTQAITGTFTLTGVGFSGVAPTGVVSYRIVQNVATIAMPLGLQGPSNSTSFSANGFPSILVPATLQQQQFSIQGFSNGAEVTTGVQMTLNLPSTNSCVFTVAGSQTGWSASGNKGVSFTITYPLD